MSGAISQVFPVLPRARNRVSVLLDLACSGQGIVSQGVTLPHRRMVALLV